MDRYYAVESVTQRRTRPTDGAVEYCVRWEGYGPSGDTWEPRSTIGEWCSALVQEVDQSEMNRTDGEIAEWRAAKLGGKRPRETASEEVEMLSSVILRDGNTSGGSGGSASLVLLGELTTTSEVAEVLGGGGQRRKVKAQGQGQREELASTCAAAVQLERRWRSRYGISAMHSCANCGACTPLAGNFATALPAHPTRESEAEDIEILAIGPPLSAAGGAAFRGAVSPVPLIGAPEAERLRGAVSAQAPSLVQTAQELLSPHTELLVVQFRRRGERGSEVKDKQGDGEEGEKPKRDAVHTLPLSAFRLAYPQLTLDFLLRAALVLED